MNRRAIAAGLPGAVLGVALFVAIYGVSIVSPARIDWLLHGDPAQHYLGFAFFRNEAWGWPIGAIRSFGTPSVTSVVFTDSIPLLALPAKLAAAWLPQDFQYFGAWMLACYALQGFFAHRVLALLGVRGLAAIAGAGLLVTSPALALRAYGHESLMAHWLLLASFEAHLAGRSSRQGPLLFLGALVHAYWLAMLLPFAALAWWRMRGGWRHAFGWCALIASAMWASGYFIARPSQLAVHGYTFYSANLLSFFDPMDWMAFLAHYGRPTEGAAEWSRLLPSLGQAGAGQYEGFAYLGAGVLALLAIAVVLAIARAPNAPHPSIRPLLAIAVVLFVFALSTRVTIGAWVVTDPALPPRALDLLSVFRSTGRFVWPLALLVPLAAFSFLARRSAPGPLAAILAAALLVQGWDLAPKWGEFGRRFAPGALARVPDFSEPGWAAASRARHLVVLPASREAGWIEPALFAARHGLTVNLAYVARGDEETEKQLESDAVDRLSSGAPAPDTAYWLRDPALAARLVPQLAHAAKVVPMREGVMVIAR